MKTKSHILLFALMGASSAYGQDRYYDNVTDGSWKRGSTNGQSGSKIRVRKRDALMITGQMQMNLELPEITIRPQIMKVSETAGTDVGLFGINFNTGGGDTTYYNRDIYFKIVGTPQDFYFDLLVLQCDSGGLAGLSSFSRRISFGQITYAGREDWLANIKNAAVNLVDEHNWMMDEFPGRADEFYTGYLTGNPEPYHFLCSDQFKKHMGDFHLDRHQKKSYGAFSLDYTHGKSPKLRLTWDKNWKDPAFHAARDLMENARFIVKTTPASHAVGDPIEKEIEALKAKLSSGADKLEGSLGELKRLTDQVIRGNYDLIEHAHESYGAMISNISFVRMMSAPLNLGKEAGRLAQLQFEQMANAPRAESHRNTVETLTLEIQARYTTLSEDVERLLNYLSKAPQRK